MEVTQLGQGSQFIWKIISLIVSNNVEINRLAELITMKAGLINKVGFEAAEDHKKKSYH